MPNGTSKQEPRYQLFRLLGEPQRLKLLGLAAMEELSVGELAELLHESQPNISRHVNLLRQAGLLHNRHQGTRVFIRLAEAVRADNVVSDAIVEGQRLCEEGDSLARIPRIIAARDQNSRAYFAEQVKDGIDTSPADNVPVFALALAMMAPTRGVALDAGTGDGTLLDLLAPSYENVIAVDRSAIQLERARERVARRGYTNVELVCSEVESEHIRLDVKCRVDALFASRMLHHTSNPRSTLTAFAKLLGTGGQICIIDYMSHDDERMREQRADVWMGFGEVDLAMLLGQAGFTQVMFKEVPKGYLVSGFDAHIPWFVATARRDSGNKSSTKYGSRLVDEGR